MCIYICIVKCCTYKYIYIYDIGYCNYYPYGGFPKIRVPLNHPFEGKTISYVIYTEDPGDIWRFPDEGTRPEIIHLNRKFHEKNHPFGYPHDSGNLQKGISLRKI